MAISPTSFGSARPRYRAAPTELHESDAAEETLALGRRSMSSPLDRGNDAVDPSSDTPTGRGEAGSSAATVLDIRLGVRKAHGYQLTDDNIMRAVESTIEVADGVLLA